jgi:hypothetical protein
VQIRIAFQVGNKNNDRSRHPQMEKSRAITIKGHGLSILTKTKNRIAQMTDGLKPVM